MRSTLHIFCKFGLALVRTSLVVFRLAPRTEKKKKKKRPATPSFPSINWSQQSLHIFSKRGPAPVPGSDLLPKKKKKSAVRSTLHIFCKFGLALVRTSLVVFRLAPRTEKKKKKKPATPSFPSINWSQQSLHIFSKRGPAPVPGSDLLPKKKKKCGAVDPPHFL